MAASHEKNLVFQNDPDLPDEINLEDNSLPNPGTIAGEDFAA